MLLDFISITLYLSACTTICLDVVVLQLESNFFGITDEAEKDNESNDQVNPKNVKHEVFPLISLIVQQHTGSLESNDISNI